ncbi:MAG: hypothetical protein LBC04_04605 [Holosporaceae bacterium]|jgi:large subunit ribosomal protein L7/L12|nr:hypothetical protein [Holosporaceae bacterium]
MRLSANLDKIVEELSKLMVLEAAELSKKLEEIGKVSVSAAARKTKVFGMKIFINFVK